MEFMMNDLHPNAIVILLLIMGAIAYVIFRFLKFQYNHENFIWIAMIDFLAPAVLFLLFFDIHPLLGLWAPGLTYLAISITHWTKIALKPPVWHEVLDRPIKFRGIINGWDWTTAAGTTVFTFGLFTMGLYIMFIPQ